MNLGTVKADLKKHEVSLFDIFSVVINLPAISRLKRVPLLIPEGSYAGKGELNLHLTERCPQNPFSFDRFRDFCSKNIPVAEFSFIFSAFKL